MNTKKIYILPVVSGIFSAVPFLLHNLYFLIFISLSPTLCCILKYKNYSFSLMFFHLFSFYIFSDLWFYSIGIEFVSPKILGFLLSLIILILIALILSVSSALPYFLLRYVKTQNSLLTSVCISFIYIFGEWFHELSPVRFPWNRLCNIAVYDNQLIQTSSILGGLFISLIIVFTNSCIACTIIHFNQNKIKSFLFIITSVIIYSINNYSGHLVKEYYTQLHNAQTGSPHNLMIIQPAFSKHKKHDSSPEKLLDELLSIAENNQTMFTDMILFPETSFSSDFFTENAYKSKIMKLSADSDKDILFGVSFMDNDKLFNSCLVVSPDNKISEIYSKRMLVPFGEYTPSFFPENFNFLECNYCNSDDNIIINSSIGKIGCAICFESIFPALVADNSRAGAELTVILTNDSWLGYNIPLEQHHTNSILRAVENRKYTVTAANTGISSVISPDGEILASSEKNKLQTISAPVYTNNIVTFYAKYGNIIVLPAFFIIIILLINMIIEKINLHIRKN